MKNSVICNNCQTENPFYKLNCENCKSYIRDRVYNIDLGNIIARLIESPASGFRTIIFSEHKNFLIFLILLSILKFEIDSIFISLFFKKEIISLDNFAAGYLVLAIILATVFLLFSYLVTILNKKLGYETRVMDNFSIYFYSFLPHIFALIILFPLELVMFGEYLFSRNPSPFALKEFIAYALFILEILIILWSLFLTIISNYTQTKNILYSIIISIIFQSLLFFILYSYPKIL
ncbi:MAG: YIP1 family protein [Ignavibacteriaceae bacterium]